jgi:hypothetical protein
VTSPIALPDDVVRYISDLFVTANDAVAARLDRMPTVHEESLDLALIDVIAAAVGPHVVPSGVVVDVDVHFLGGGVHWDRWEVADIGMIFNFRRGANLIRTKILLLQSKRLYPREAEFVEDRGITRVGGFGSLMVPSPLEVSASRLFRFDGRCRYKALQVGDDQWRAIAAYEGQHRIPVYYLLYHPSRLPFERVLPVQVPLPRRRGHAGIGTRVLRAADPRDASAALVRNEAPSFDVLRQTGDAPGMPLQEFIASGILGCREGYVASDPANDEGLLRVFNLRSAPIAAAVRFDIDLGQWEGQQG